MRKENNFFVIHFLLSLIFCTSCKEKERVNYFFKLTDFQEKFKPKEINHIYLKDFYNLKDSINVNYFYFFNDSIIIIDKIPDPFYLEVYDYKNMKSLGNYARRGKGPGEYLGPMVDYIDNECFVVHDVVKSAAAVFYIDSIIIKGEDYNPVLISIPDFAKRVANFNKDTLLCFNSYYLSNEKYFTNNVECLFFIDERKKYKDFSTFLKDKNPKYFTSNVSDVKIIILKEYIWVVHKYDNRIEIYDKKLKRIKNLYGPEKYRPKYAIEDYGYNHVSFDKKNGKIETFVQSRATKDAVYISYIGSYFKSKPDGVGLYPISSILKFSVEGKPLADFEIGMNIFSFYIDEDNNKIYCDSPKNNIQIFNF